MPAERTTQTEEPDRRGSYCFVLPWSFMAKGGVNQVVENLMVDFAARGPLKPIALELQWDASDSCDTVHAGAKRTYVRLRPTFVPGKGLRGILGFVWEAPSTMRKLSRYARENNVAAFNYFFPCLAAMNFVLLKKLRMFDGDIILTFQGSDIRSAHQAKGRWLWKWMFRQVDSIVACSDGMREEALMLEPNANVVTIHNAIDANRFLAGAQKFDLPAELVGARVIVNVAGFEFRKGHDVLLRAFQRVASVYKDAMLLLVGKPGETSGAVRSLITELNLERRVVVIEDAPHTAIPTILAASELFVMATRWRKTLMGEGFAVAILEAGVAGVPVVSTASCGVAELIEDGKTGRVTPVEDPDALAAAICDVLAAPDEARRMASSLNAVIRERFTWKLAAERYLSLVRNKSGSQ